MALLDAALMAPQPRPPGQARGGYRDPWGVPARLYEHPQPVHRPVDGPLLDHRVLTEQDGRLYRCPGCGDWRYRLRLGRHRGGQPACTTCGHA